jgi:hypothetical protein
LIINAFQNPQSAICNPAKAAFILSFTDAVVATSSDEVADDRANIKIFFKMVSKGVEKFISH